MRVLAVCALLAISLFLRPAAYADDAATGVITVEITDAAKKGVAGIAIIAKVNGTEVTATTGAQQASDSELAAAARQGQKAIAALNSKYNARAVLTGIPLGAASITLVGIKSAKPISATITSDQPAWKLTATVDSKAKKVIGAARIVFDEVANAKLQTERAKAEQARAKAAAEAAKAEQERLRQAQEKATADQERARQDKDRADADARRARDQAEAERLRRARAEAPSKVSVTAPYCSCQAGQTIQVRCTVKNDAEVPVKVSLDVFAEAGTWGNNAAGKANTDAIAAGTMANYDLKAAMQTSINCKSCKNQKCTITGVTPQ